MLEATYEDRYDFLAKADHRFGERGWFFLETHDIDQPLGIDLPVRLSFRSPERSFSVHGRVVWRRAREGTSKGKRLPVGLAIEVAGGHDDDLDALLAFLDVPRPEGLHGSLRAPTLKIAFDDAQAVLDLLDDVNGTPTLFVATKVTLAERLRLVITIKHPGRMFWLDVHVRQQDVVRSTIYGRIEGAIVALQTTDSAHPAGLDAFLAFLTSQRPRGLPA